MGACVIIAFDTKFQLPKLHGSQCQLERLKLLLVFGWLLVGCWLAAVLGRPGHLLT